MPEQGYVSLAGTILELIFGMKHTPKEDTADHKGENLHQLQTEELTSEETSPEEEDLDASDTDDDEDEGVGDGNLGKTTPDILEK